MSLDTPVKTRLVKYRHHRPRVVVGTTAKGAAEAPRIIAELNQVFRRNFSPPGPPMAMGDWLVAFPSLGVATAGVLSQRVNQKCKRFFEELHAVLLEIG